MTFNYNKSFVPEYILADSQLHSQYLQVCCAFANVFQTIDLNLQPVADATIAQTFGEELTLQDLQNMEDMEDVIDEAIQEAEEAELIKKEQDEEDADYEDDSNWVGEGVVETPIERIFYMTRFGAMHPYPCQVEPTVESSYVSYVHEDKPKSCKAVMSATGYAPEVSGSTYTGHSKSVAKIHHQKPQPKAVVAKEKVVDVVSDCTPKPQAQTARVIITYRETRTDPTWIGAGGGPVTVDDKSHAKNAETKSVADVHHQAPEPKAVVAKEKVANVVQQPTPQQELNRLIAILRKPFDEMNELSKKQKPFYDEFLKRCRDPDRGNRWDEMRKAIPHQRRWCKLYQDQYIPILSQIKDFARTHTLEFNLDTIITTIWYPDDPLYNQKHEVLLPTIFNNYLKNVNASGT